MNCADCRIELLPNDFHDVICGVCTKPIAKRANANVRIEMIGELPIDSPTLPFGNSPIISWPVCFLSIRCLP